MTLRPQILSILAFLGILGTCSAADARNDFQDLIKPSEQIQLNDLLSISDKNNLLNSAALMQMTTNSGTIHFLKAYLYSSSNCTTGLLGAVSVVDNGTGFSFTAGQTISLNKTAAYKLFTNSGQGTNANPNNPTNVLCMKLYLTGGNQTKYNSPCMTFDENCSSGTACQTGTSPNVPWTNTSQTPCQTPLLYVTSSSSTDPTSWYCTIDGGGTLTCNPFTSTTVANGIAINNGYAYITNQTSNTITPCPINAANGIPGTCSTAQTYSATGPTGIALNAGIYYFTGSTGFIYAGGINQTLGTLTPASPSATNYGGPLGININNNFAYFTNKSPTTGDVVYLCTLLGVCNFQSAASTISSEAVTAAYDIALYNGHAYIPYKTATTTGIMFCEINSVTGELSNCLPTGGGLGINNPQSIVIYDDIAYIGNQNGNGLGGSGLGFIGYCPVSLIDGSLGTNCDKAFSMQSIPRLKNINLMAIY